MTENTLYYGDNLDILRRYIKDESVDLEYLDPPFNSNRSYNVLFRESGKVTKDSPSRGQITAFDDTWHWGDSAEETLREIQTTAQPHVVEMMQAIVGFVGRNDVTAYLVMMTVRLIELHRVLKPTGSIYLHCDPTASHYLKVVMDTIFGPENLRNEIVWKRTSSHNDSSRFGRVHDVILYYVKSGAARFNVQRKPLDPEYVRKVYSRVDENGRHYRLDNISAPGGRGPVYEWGGITQAWRYTKENMERLYEEGRIRKYPNGRAMINAYVRYLDESEGQPIQDWWDDIGVIAAPAKERLGYPTQKPLALLERIIQASSNPNDLVLDPFCGCGTTVCAAEKSGRHWIGIDITHLAIALMRKRLDDMFGDKVEYQVVGQPADLASAQALALQDRHGFETWAVSLIKAQPAQDKKGSDRGMDGLLFFVDEVRAPAKKVVIQVKSGHVQSSYIRDLAHVVDREKAALGFLISLEQPSRPMLTEALTEGYYHSPGWNRDYSKLQIRTIEQLLAGHWFEYPQANVTLSQADRVEERGEQGQLL